MSDLFYEDECIESLNLNRWDTSNVKDMTYMFSESNYNHPLYFDTSNVHGIENIFDGGSITSPIIFKGGNIPDDIQYFINETNIVYEEKCKIKESVQYDNVVVQPLKL